MKKSELRQIIREEIQKLNEKKDFKISGPFKDNKEIDKLFDQYYEKHGQINMWLVNKANEKIAYSEPDKKNIKNFYGFSQEGEYFSHSVKDIKNMIITLA